MPPVCPQEVHAAIKRDDSAWSACKYIGVQVVPADDTGPEERLELRNCRCGSTLCRVIKSRP